MQMTEHQWQTILSRCGVDGQTARDWAPVLEHTIDDRTFSAGLADIPPFLGTILHESKGLTRMTENLNYRAARIREIGAQSGSKSRWRAAAARADELAHNPEGLANFLYGGRYGNYLPDDGYRFRGRTPIGLTFRDNYKYVGRLIGQDLESVPELMEQKHFGLEACIAWWEGVIPDEMLGDYVAVRKKVQGGDLGLSDTRRKTMLAQAALDEVLA